MELTFSSRDLKDLIRWNKEEGSRSRESHAPKERYKAFKDGKRGVIEANTSGQLFPKDRSGNLF